MVMVNIAVSVSSYYPWILGLPPAFKVGFLRGYVVNVTDSRGCLTSLIFITRV